MPHIVRIGEAAVYAFFEELFDIPEGDRYWTKKLAILTSGQLALDI